jgi:hypothetical protein
MKRNTKAIKLALASGVALSLISGAPYAQTADNCGGLEQALGVADPVGIHGALVTAIGASGPADIAANGGFGLHMWATLVDRDGFVCAVAFSGADRGSQWPASRVIAAQKASTGNSLSLDGLALSTANLYGSAQPGGSLFGVQEANATDTTTAYDGDPANYGQPTDPLVGKRMGGHNVFGGGFAVYNEAGQVIGGLGASGDTACKDHNFAWRVRNALGLDNVAAGPASLFAGDAAHPDNAIYDMGKANRGNVTSKSGFGHVRCDVNNDSNQNALTFGGVSGLPAVGP